MELSASIIVPLLGLGKLKDFSLLYSLISRPIASSIFVSKRRQPGSRGWGAGGRTTVKHTPLVPAAPKPPQALPLPVSSCPTASTIPRRTAPRAGPSRNPGGSSSRQGRTPPPPPQRPAAPPQLTPRLALLHSRSRFSPGGETITRFHPLPGAAAASHVSRPKATGRGGTRPPPPGAP